MNFTEGIYVFFHFSSAYPLTLPVTFYGDVDVSELLLR